MAPSVPCRNAAETPDIFPPTKVGDKVGVALFVSTRMDVYNSFCFTLLETSKDHGNHGAKAILSPKAKRFAEVGTAVQNSADVSLVSLDIPCTKTGCTGSSANAKTA
jgi:hypothetical protein